MLSRLGRAGVTSLVVEGGSETLESFFQAGLVDRVTVFVSPRILGGKDAVGAVGGRGFSLSRAPILTDIECERVGRDLMMTARPRR